MRIARAAAVAALAFCFSGSALAGDPPRRTVDKNIEKAAARIAAEKLGELRGLILEEAGIDHLATGAVANDTQKAPPKAAPQDSENSSGNRKLPPIVRNNRDLLNLEPFATQRMLRTADGRERVSMVFGAPGSGDRSFGRLPRLD